MTEVTISTQKSTSDFSQDMEHEIELDYKMSLYKHGDEMEMAGALSISRILAS